MAGVAHFFRSAWMDLDAKLSPYPNWRPVAKKMFGDTPERRGLENTGSVTVRGPGWVQQAPGLEIQPALAPAPQRFQVESPAFPQCMDSA